MSHFAFESSLNDVIRMDASVEAGPMLRWQRKALEAGMKSMSLDGENKKFTATASKLSIGQKTPIRSPQVNKLASSNMPPKAEQKMLNKTPCKQYAAAADKFCPVAGGLKNKAAKTPNKTPLGDRFIPNRSSMDMDAGHFRLLSCTSEMEEIAPEGSETEYKRHVSEALGTNPNSKILCFKEKAPAAKDYTCSNINVLYSATVKTKSAAYSRVIPQNADRVLDAPLLLDDYYLNLLSWSAVSNLVALALGPSVYLLNASSGAVTELCELTATDDYVSSVSWLSHADVLAVGNSVGSVQIWDVSIERLVRTMTGHAARVGSLDWNAHMLSSGCRSGAIHQHDVRVATHHIGSLVGHSQEVCGLRWSPDGRYLASGANDNLLCLWDHSSVGHSVAPIMSFNQHMAAVKAIAWCPWQASLLASGGGSLDRQIRLWNVSSGTCLHTVETNSQVSALLWSSHHREIVSGHGYSQNQLTLWKYPSMTRIADLTGHTSRVLGLALSPDGCSVASISADETLRFWKCLDHDKHNGKAPLNKGVVSKDTSADRHFGSLNLLR